MQLGYFLKTKKIKYCDFAKVVNCTTGRISQIINKYTTISNGVSLKLALNIQKATNNEVMPIDLLLSASLGSGEVGDNNDKEGGSPSNA
jgi:hypothetical protein